MPASEDSREVIAEQVSVMEEAVTYQLQRATTGSHNLLRLMPVFPVVDRLVTSFRKVYFDKAIVFELSISQEAHFRGDERNLLELLGNIIDIACKYGSGKVFIGATLNVQALSIVVEDDGDGIPAAIRNAIVERGVRADTTVSGQGIGLAVAADISKSYEGELSIGQSKLGGARIQVKF